MTRSVSTALGGSLSGCRGVRRRHRETVDQISVVDWLPAALAADHRYLPRVLKAAALAGRGRAALTCSFSVISATLGVLRPRYEKLGRRAQISALVS